MSTKVLKIGDAENMGYYFQTLQEPSNSDIRNTALVIEK